MGTSHAKPPASPPDGILIFGMVRVNRPARDTSILPGTVHVLLDLGGAEATCVVTGWVAATGAGVSGGRAGRHSTTAATTAAAAAAPAAGTISRRRTRRLVGTIQARPG